MMNRLIALESGTDVTISTFPLPRDLARTRRAIAHNRHLLEYFSNIDHTSNSQPFRNIYMDYQWFWHELYACVLTDLRTRIRNFTQLHGQTVVPQNNAVTTGYLAGCDANAAYFLSAAFRIIRSSYALRTVSDALRTNTFYQRAHPTLVQTITQLLYDCIVSPRPNGFVFSFHEPNLHAADQIEAVQTHIVVNEDEFYENTVPIVPFLFHGGSGRVIDGDAYQIALPYPVRLQNDTHVRPNVDDLLHDHDIVFQSQFRAPPVHPGDYIRMNNSIEILTNGQGTELRTDFVQRYQLYCDYL